MINGTHVIIYSSEAEADRGFLRDVLGFPYVDAGDGWLLFRPPTAEIALHPSGEPGVHELYLMCDNLASTMEDLAAKGVEFTRPVSDRGWGLITWLQLPGGSELGLYEPHHLTALDA